jgi:hypothetical protein
MTRTVLKLCLPLAFVEKTFLQLLVASRLRQQKLDRDPVAKVDVARLPHFRHAALPNPANEYILTDVQAVFQRCTSINKSGTCGLL